MIAAAGWHHVLLMGNPGVGKSMVAERMVGIMPAMNNSEKDLHGTPGEVTYAHRGVLIMDEFPQYRKDILEGLRTVLDSRTVLASYGSQRLTWPADFLLVATSNPCPCGYLGHPKKVCKDSPASVTRYLGRHYWVKADEPNEDMTMVEERIQKVSHYG